METAISWKAYKSLIVIKKEINMGFNKRYVSTWKLREWYKSGGITEVLSRIGQADALMCEDEFSTKLIGIFNSDKLPSDILTSMGKLLEDKFKDS
jgi:hypothetical protein